MFKRYFLSDAANQADWLAVQVPESSVCACSIVEQPPLNGTKIALWVYLQSGVQCRAQNATVKYLKNLKKIIKTALIKKWITDDPFAEIHFKQTKCNREFLNEMELRKIINKDFDIQRLQTVRDIFIFCCFTFLA